ncbi:hypothetical protein MMC14_009360 [Varicellaria rhodocarpa]|nr:hypothetical protein [Varicellaria rhodocarpa]
MGIRPPKNIAYDSKTLTLYVSLHQTFRIFLLPSFFACHARLTTVLQLVPLTSSSVNSSGTKTKYLISSQNDLYQTSEFVKFFSLFRFVYLGVLLWQFIATMFCVVGAVLGEPVSWVEENMVGGNWEKSVVKDVALAEKPREALLEKRGSLEDGRRDNVDEEREEIVGSERGESLEDEREETVSSLG